MLGEIEQLREQLHAHPELSFNEIQTADILSRWLASRGLDVTSQVAGTGLVVEVSSNADGPRRLFRADLDAIGAGAAGVEVTLGFRPEPEDADRGAEHVCGHDGHCSMLAGALAILAEQPDAWSGTVLGVFQPAEEIGTGAAAVLDDPALSDRDVDEAYAIHNQPGMPLGRVGIPVNVAALASTGIIVRMSGQTTHASTPAKGNAAIVAMATFINQLLALPNHAVPFGGSVLVTPTYMDAGKRQFGRVPPRAEMGAVIRSNSDDCLEAVLAACRKHLEALTGAYGLQAELEQIEPFPVTVNHLAQVEFAAKALQDAGMDVEVRQFAQPWSEDFGHFLAKWPGALMLLGAGEDQPELHSADYEFPDRLLPYGVKLWLTLAGWTGASTIAP